MAQLASADDQNFEDLITGERIFIVDFWSPTCAPCIQIEPELKMIAAEHQDKVKIIKVNVNESPGISSKYLIRSIPTLLFIKNKNVLTQLVGSVNKSQIENKLREII